MTPTESTEAPKVTEADKNLAVLLNAAIGVELSGDVEYATKQIALHRTQAVATETVKLRSALEHIRDMLASDSPRKNQKAWVIAHATLSRHPNQKDENNGLVMVRDCWNCNSPTMYGDLCSHCGAKYPWNQQPDEPDTAHTSREERTHPVPLHVTKKK